MVRAERREQEMLSWNRWTAIISAGVGAGTVIVLTAFGFLIRRYYIERRSSSISSQKVEDQQKTPMTAKQKTTMNPTANAHQESPPNIYDPCSNRSSGGAQYVVVSPVKWIPPNSPYATCLTRKALEGASSRRIASNASRCSGWWQLLRFCTICHLLGLVTDLGQVCGLSHNIPVRQRFNSR